MKLAQIQNELKANKGQWNDFSKYNYRSCEDILESLKPLLLQHKCHLVLTDDIREVGGRVYVKATAILTDFEDKSNFWSVNAFARECQTKKGMDEAQITGSASSYARKYALNGLFAIDDTKDADTMDNTAKPAEKPAPAAKSEAPKLTPSEAAEAMAAKNADLSWFEITWPWSMPKECAKKPLSDLAANANVDALKKMHDHFKKLTTDKTPALVKYVEKVGMALTEAESTAELTGKDNGSVK